MKMLFKQRISMWLDKFDIFDEAGNTLFTVKGRFAFGKHLVIFDRDGNEVGAIKEELLSLFPKYNIFMGNDLVGTIYKEFSFFRPKFTIDFNGWNVQGDYFEFDYSIFNSLNQEVAVIKKEVFNWTDTYSIDVVNSSDALLALMLVLAIDANKATRG